MIEFEWLWAAAFLPLPLLALLLPKATRQDAALHVPFMPLRQVTRSAALAFGIEVGSVDPWHFFVGCYWFSRPCDRNGSVIPLNFQQPDVT